MPILLISFCVAAANLLTSPPADTRALAGYWRVEYLPNRAVRFYEVKGDGTASFAEFPRWKGRLTREKGWTLRFEGDPDERKERLTLCEDGRLLVEHFNPTAIVDSPDQIGVATRVKAGMLPGHAYPSPSLAEQEILDDETMRRARTFIPFPAWQPQKLVGHKVDLTVTVMTEGPKPIVTLDPEKPDAPWTQFLLVNLSADNALKKGQRLKLRGLIVDSAYGFWHVWSKSLEFAKN